VRERGWSVLVRQTVAEKRRERPPVDITRPDNVRNERWNSAPWRPTTSQNRMPDKTRIVHRSSWGGGWGGGRRAPNAQQKRQGLTKKRRRRGNIHQHTEHSQGACCASTPRDDGREGHHHAASVGPCVEQAHKEEKSTRVRTGVGEDCKQRRPAAERRQASNKRVYADRPSATATENGAGARTEQPATATIRTSSTALIRAVTYVQPRWPVPETNSGL